VKGPLIDLGFFGQTVHAFQNINLFELPYLHFNDNFYGKAQVIENQPQRREKYLVTLLCMRRKILDSKSSNNNMTPRCKNVQVQNDVNVCGIFPQCLL
jgi:hypothetical protein